MQSKILEMFMDTVVHMSQSKMTKYLQYSSLMLDMISVLFRITLDIGTSVLVSICKQSEGFSSLHLIVKILESTIDKNQHIHVFLSCTGYVSHVIEYNCKTGTKIVFLIIDRYNLYSLHILCIRIITLKFHHNKLSLCLVSSSGL